MVNKKIKALSKWLEEQGYNKQVVLNPYCEGYVRMFDKNGFDITLTPMVMNVEGKEMQYWRGIIYGKNVYADFVIVNNRLTLKKIKEYIKRVKRYDKKKASAN